MSLNVIMEVEQGPEMGEHGATYLTTRRYELADSPAARGGKSRPSHQSQSRILAKEFRKAQNNAADKDVSVASTNDTSSIFDDEIEVSKEQVSAHHHGSSRGARTTRDSGSPSKSFDTVTLSNGDSFRPTTGIGIVPDSNQSVMSDLSGSMKPRRSPPRGSPPRKIRREMTDADSKKTENTLFESMYDAVCDFCSVLGPVEENSTTPSKGDRKQDAEETFLGKIITCQMIDVDDFGCGGCVSL